VAINMGWFDRAEFGPNVGLIDEMYRKYLDDPESVSEAWREFFAENEPDEDGDAAAAAAEPAEPAEGRTEAEQPAQVVGVAGLGAGPKHPGLELVVQHVASGLQGGDLGGQSPVVEQERGVGQAHGRLRGVLHLHQDVHRPVQLGERRRFRLRGGGKGRRPGHGSDQVHALLRSLVQQHVALGDHAVGPWVELPVVAPADGQDPHARLRGERQVPECRPHHLRPLADLDPPAHLVGVAEVGPERVGNPELRRHDSRDVGRRVADLVDGVCDPQHALDGLGVLRASGGQDGERSEAAEVTGHPLLELLDLIGHVLVVEEDCRIGHVDQEL